MPGRKFLSLSSLLLLLTTTATTFSSVDGAATWLPPTSSNGAIVTNGTSPNAQWTTVLGSLLYFYDEQRSGKLGADNRVPWRNDSSLQDGRDVGLDLTGGFYDAGNYVKATYPLAWSWWEIIWGALEYGNGYDQAEQTKWLDSTLRWGLDWMIRAHPSPNSLAVFVGDSSVDGAYWGGDNSIPSYRPTYMINETSPGTDVAAQTSAMFALASMLYTPMGDAKGTSVTLNATSSSSSPSGMGNQTYAEELMKHAEDLYKFAQTAKQVTYTKSVPNGASAYPSLTFTDDLALAALSLALATNSSTYYQDAYQIYVNNSLTGSMDVLNWASKTPALYILFAQVATARPSLAAGAGLSANLTGWQHECEAYLDSVLSQQRTPHGLVYYEGDSDEASLNPALNAAMLMLRYAPLASSESKSKGYLAFAHSQIDYSMGDNPINSPYIVGIHPNSPSNPSSAIAAGGNDINSINTNPTEMAYVLYGALVGGPAKDDKFYNLRDDYPQTEPALDYNPPMLTIAAYMVSNMSLSLPRPKRQEKRCQRSKKKERSVTDD